MDDRELHSIEEARFVPGGYRSGFIFVCASVPCRRSGDDRTDDSQNVATPRDHPGSSLGLDSKGAHDAFHTDTTFT